MKVSPEADVSHNVDVQPVGSENVDENDDNETTDEVVTLSEEVLRLYSWRSLCSHR